MDQNRANNQSNILKHHNGKPYLGMPVGRSHHWDYPMGVWNETKVAPDRWKFDFTCTKRRHNAAPAGSGVEVGSQYHWYILADQIVKKLDTDQYITEMQGMKFKLGHRRPYWRGFSYDYKEQQSYNERLIDILQNALEELKPK